MLRKHDWLLKALKLDNESLITSSVAGRINGYVGGYGDEVRIIVRYVKYYAAEANVIKRMMV